jgi:hypothetical protein
VGIDGAAAIAEELAAVVDEEQMVAGKGELEPFSSQGPEGLVLVPGKGNAGEGPAAGAVAVAAAFRVFQGAVKQQTVPFFLGAP